MTKSHNFLAMLAGVLLWGGPALAHFLEIIPQTDILPEDGDRQVRLALSFTHPMERGPVMEMAPPVRVGALSKSGITALAAKPAGKGFEAAYTVPAPGDTVFFIEPKPYWEAAEGKYIIHYAKVVVDFGAGSGWDRLVGLPVEIEPLTRPYGLWTGNLFLGVVRQGGKPVPFAEIEVEWRNDGSVKAPSDPFVTQVIKADANGTFAYAMPRAGWWGFAALVDGKPLNGKPVELGGLIWVNVRDMK